MASGESSFPSKVLFIGNSLTYKNDLDQQVRDLASATFPGTSFTVDRCVRGGASLKVLWNTTDARSCIAAGAYDVVVLQEDLPETNVADFYAFGTRFHEAIADSGAKTVLLMAWPYERLSWISIEGIADAHDKLASSLGAIVAPAGIAWKRAAIAKCPGRRRRLPKLYQSDLEHPSLCGTYLTAAVVFSTLWGRSPLGLPSTVGGAIHPEDLEFLQQVALETLQGVTDSQAVAHRMMPLEDSPAVAHRSPQEVHTCARADLVLGLFQELDRDKDGHLNSDELRPFLDFIGFHGDDDAWADEFRTLCAEVGQPDGRSICIKGFSRLVDCGTQDSLFCTDCADADLHECLSLLRSTPAAKRCKQ